MSRFDSFEKYGIYEYNYAKRCIIPYLSKFVTLQGKRTIDIGCGIGGTTIALSENCNSVIGLDIDANIIKQAQIFAQSMHSNATFMIIDTNMIPLIPDSVDIVIMLDVLEHIGDPQKALLSIHNVLKSDGLLYVSFPPYYSPFGGHLHQPNNPFRFIPYAHLMFPEKIIYHFVKKARTYGFITPEVIINNYEGLNKITIKKFRQIVKEAEYGILKEDLYIFRPTFKERLNLPELKAGVLGHIPYLREYCVLGCSYLLKPLKP